MLETAKKKSYMFKYIPCYCSIERHRLTPYVVNLFKYILCYCSTNPIQRKKRDKLRLNTSYVIVQQEFRKRNSLTKAFKYISCYY